MAGSFGEPSFGNDLLSGSMFSMRIPFATDDVDGTIEAKTFTMPHGSFLADVDYVSEDTMTLAISVKTLDGVVAHPNDTISLAANTRYILSDRPSLIGGFELSATNAGAGDSGKSGTVILNFASNNR